MTKVEEKTEKDGEVRRLTERQKRKMMGEEKDVEGEGERKEGGKKRDKEAGWFIGKALLSSRLKPKKYHTHPSLSMD